MSNMGRRREMAKGEKQHPEKQEKKKMGEWCAGEWGRNDFKEVVVTCVQCKSEVKGNTDGKFPLEFTRGGMFILAIVVEEESW